MRKQGDIAASILKRPASSPGLRLGAFIPRTSANTRRFTTPDLLPHASGGISLPCGSPMPPTSASIR